MAVAQLVERSLPIAEVHGSSPVIGKIYIEHVLYWKDENKEKEAGNGPFLKRNHWVLSKTELYIPNIGSDQCIDVCTTIKSIRAIGRVVAANTLESRFKSSDWHFYRTSTRTIVKYWKVYNNEKEVGNVHFIVIITFLLVPLVRAATITHWPRTRYGLEWSGPTSLEWPKVVWNETISGHLDFDQKLIIEGELPTYVLGGLFQL